MGMNGNHHHHHHHHYMGSVVPGVGGGGGGYSYPASHGFTGFYGCVEHHHVHAPYQYINMGPTNAQELEYWSMHMNAYKYGVSSGQDAATSYYGLYENVVDHGPIRANWDYAAAAVTNVEGGSMDLDVPSEQSVVSDVQYIPEESSLDEEDDAVNTQVILQDDMDPDTMTYEELLDLGEAVGAQSRGLSQELINRLPTSKHKSGGIFSRKKSEDRCVICQMRYKRGDRQINLPCKHAYHTECGSKWLSINRTCPVCNTEVFADEPSH